MTRYFSLPYLHCVNQGRLRLIKMEPDDYQENEYGDKKLKQLKEPKSVVVKQECFSHDDSNSPKRAGSEQVIHSN